MKAPTSLEDASVSTALARVCEDNARLAAMLAGMEGKLAELVGAEGAPKASGGGGGWFGRGARRGAREEPGEDLRGALVAYKTSHAASNEEVAALMAGLRAAHENAARLAEVVRAQQEAPRAGDSGREGELRAAVSQAQARLDALARDLQRAADERDLARGQVRALEEDLHRLRAAGKTGGGMLSPPPQAEKGLLAMEMSLQRAKDENARLNEELRQVRQDLAGQEGFYAMTKAEYDELAVRGPRPGLANGGADADPARALAEARQELQRLERGSVEDKQRVAFLLKKCAAVAAELQAANAARDALAEDQEKLRLELKQLQRQVERQAEVQTRYDELVKECEQVEARLASAAELEEKLVRAKETIAYMELAQSRDIHISQYAELQAANQKLEDGMAPLRRSLEEAEREVARLRGITEAQQVVIGEHVGGAQNLQDQLDSLTASEAKLREKVAGLSAENNRLQQLNRSLEFQMTEMQDGIKEMAMQMEKERSSARAAAEEAWQRQVEELHAQLGRANETIAKMQATSGAFVPEGLHQSTLTERDRLAGELAAMAVELEKLKSEILIYRKTIADLENENDEHVGQMESLQERHQADRAALADRLAAEQKRFADLSEQFELLKEREAALTARVAQNAAEMDALRERNDKHERAFRERGCRDEQLTARVAALEAELAGGAAAAPEELARLQGEKDALEAEVRRLREKRKAERGEARQMIQTLQAELRGAPREAEVAPPPPAVPRAKRPKRRTLAEQVGIAPEDDAAPPPDGAQAEAEAELAGLRAANASLTETNAQLTVELYNAHRAAGLASAQRKEVHRKDAEIQALLAELMPTKKRLLEYMAVADRLGLAYPFPAQFEGAAMVRVRALKKPRANGGKKPAPPRGQKGPSSPSLPHIKSNYDDYLSLR